MAQSGVDIDENIIQEFVQIKLRRSYSYMVFRITPDWKKIVIEKLEPSQKKTTPQYEADYLDFVKGLPPNDCRYIVYDFNYTDSRGNEAAKLLFLVWCPDTAPIKSKMLYSSSKDALKKKLEAVREVQCNDLSDIAYEQVLTLVAPKA